MRLLKWGRTQFWLFWSYFAGQGRNRMVMKYSLVLAKAYLVLDNASPMAGEKCFFPVYTKTKKSLWAVCFAHICRTCLAVLVRGVCKDNGRCEWLTHSMDLPALFLPELLTSQQQPQDFPGLQWTSFAPKVGGKKPAPSPATGRQLTERQGKNVFLP